MKNLMQLKSLIRNLSKEKNLNPQIVLRIYMMERILERISISSYKNNFILKGGMLVTSLAGVAERATIDMDITLKSIKLTSENIKNIFEELINIDLNDGVEFELERVSEIREEDNYYGYRISIISKLEKAKIPLKIDITTGDKITPSEIQYKYKLLLENRNINIFAYNKETLLAEKIETIISRNILNSRMKDFYDIYIIFKLFDKEIDKNTLKEAIYETFTKRETINLLKDKDQLVANIFKDQNMKNYWEQYTNKYSYSKNISWEEIELLIKSIISMI
ncbi:hypothetical protein CN13_06610 [Petrotoga sp. HKA.pet.4.5]|uniref:nucleotidyl transferase AbiEii/AbiGii toxin family protein n=1 Tax=Petrotoga sp. HKA.pet.4.5 TaxID=1473155 RepID=UPI000EF13FF9|nr:nucleotidyl transferase AbiEii/AbiGii toxin family protein [Petrotoga sp. HKA.pet.4.5]RLL89075.1 hypothetical protein CN13_06610 [Petrotoga sp. HKA.pet.4.5]